jgi:hypothetical protein
MMSVQLLVVKLKRSKLVWMDREHQEADDMPYVIHKHHRVTGKKKLQLCLQPLATIFTSERILAQIIWQTMFYIQLSQYSQNKLSLPISIRYIRQAACPYRTP